MQSVPETQEAVQLVGPDELKFNRNKEVYRPNDYQILCEVEATGLCYSDLKLLKQFDQHVRKSAILPAKYQAALREYPGYKVDREPTVPGHEAVLRVIQVGDNVTIAEPGKRYLIQPDLRWLRTKTANGSFGYCIEGALQQYALLDERLFVDPHGQSVLIEAPEDKSAAASALCEPWACVEHAYIACERTTLRDQGRLLIVAETSIESIPALPDIGSSPVKIDIVGSKIELKVPAEVRYCAALDQTDDLYDDIVYIGSDADVVEKLFDKLDFKGLLIIALDSHRLQRPIKIPVGRTHYGGIRICGTTGNDLADAIAVIPPTGEIRANDRIHIVGAGGPMGVMHVVRDICHNVPGIRIAASDLSADRLQQLAKVAQPLANIRGVEFAAYDAASHENLGPADYIVLMAPVPQLVVDAVDNAAPGGIINIFAGIPADVLIDIDLNRYIENRLYFIGTSGSTIDDMIAVLDKVKANTLDTNLSVAAITGLDGAIAGIRATEHHTIAGKIVVYPQCRGLDLTPLENLAQSYPTVAEQLNAGIWTLEAEQALLEHFREPT